MDNFDMFMKDVVDVARLDMRDAGYEELTSPEAVESAMEREGTTLVMINSVCGCAGGVARPAAEHAIHYDKRPDHLVTVFAGQDREATEKVRTYLDRKSTRLNSSHVASSYAVFCLNNKIIQHSV